jgi:leucyl-tRNA synthetase
LVLEAHSWYEKMCFREALRACYYEFGNAADQYVNVCKAGKMLPNKALMMRYYEWQLIILSPICPHICEHGWELLGKKESIHRARWPQPAQPEQQLIDQGRYLFDKVPHDFTLLLKKATAKGGTCKSATIFVAAEFPEWKVKVLSELTSRFEAGALPLVGQDELKSDKQAADCWKKIMQDLMQDPALKPFGKHLGPFAAFKRDEVASFGGSALSPKAPFEELSLIQDHIAFMENRIGIPTGTLSVRMAGQAADEHREKAGEAQPLKPSIVFELDSAPAAAGKLGAGKKPADAGKKLADSCKKPGDFVPITDMKKLNEALGTKSYMEGGHKASAADFEQFKVIATQARLAEHPHVERWAKHIKALSHRRHQF